MESVLVGVDRSESSRRGVRFALERARVNGWRVRIVHVINWSPYQFRTAQTLPERPRERRAELDLAQREVLDPIWAWAEGEGLLEGVDVVTAIRHGRPSEVLADIAAENGDDVIVVARTGESNLKTAIFGSTAYRLVQHADVPVVVVP
jgi:nucleotide-binding universal stress UspA family protein